MTEGHFNLNKSKIFAKNSFRFSQRFSSDILWFVLTDWPVFSQGSIAAETRASVLRGTDLQLVMKSTPKTYKLGSSK